MASADSGFLGISTNGHEVSDLNGFPTAAQELGPDRRAYPESAIGRTVFKNVLHCLGIRTRRRRRRGWRERRRPKPALVISRRDGTLAFAKRPDGGIGRHA